MSRINSRRVILAKEKKLIPSVAKSTTGGKTTVLQVLRAKPTATICVIRSVGGIGDVLMTLPFIAQLKADFPVSTLVYATDRHTSKEDVYYELLKNVPFIDSIIDARYVDKSQYDACVDVSSVCIRHENSGQPVLNRIDIFARAAGVTYLKDPKPFYEVTEQERRTASELLAPYKGKKLVLLHTASFDAKRTWHPRRQNEFLKLITEQRPDVQVLLSDFNKVISNARQYGCANLNTAGIRDLAAVIEQVDLFIGPDSGPMHIAGALGVESLVLFGSIPPKIRINYYPSHTAVTAKLPCLGCMYKPCPIAFKCMLDITSEQVLAAVDKAL